MAQALSGHRAPSLIESSDVGATNGWRMDDVLPSAELIERLRAKLPLVQLDPSSPGRKPPSAGAMPMPRASTTRALGEVGVISSVTQAVCHDCNRARLSTEGKLYLCLFASQGPRPAQPAARWRQRC